MVDIRHKQMAEKEKFFFKAERQLIKVKEVMKSEAHHLAASSVITDSGKSHHGRCKYEDNYFYHLIASLYRTR